MRSVPGWLERPSNARVGAVSRWLPGVSRNVGLVSVPSPPSPPPPGLVCLASTCVRADRRGNCRKLADCVPHRLSLDGQGLVRSSRIGRSHLDPFFKHFDLVRAKLAIRWHLDVFVSHGLNQQALVDLARNDRRAAGAPFCQSSLASSANPASISSPLREWQRRQCRSSRGSTCDSKNCGVASTGSLASSTPALLISEMARTRQVRFMFGATSRMRRVECARSESSSLPKPCSAMKQHGSGWIALWRGKGRDSRSSAG